MPITQVPTLSVIDQASNQFLIQFGIFMNEDQATRQSAVVPNLIAGEGVLYSVDLSRLNTPARGNIPAIRSLQVTLDSRQVRTPGPVPNLAPVYIWNPKTNQVVSFIPPPTVPTVAYPSIINAVVPFFCAPTQTIEIFYLCGNGPLDYNIGAAFSVFTFDIPPYYASDSVGWALQPGP